ncbi:Uroporphyrinogen decarboxylase [Trichinella pseudospiralis]
MAFSRICVNNNGDSSSFVDDSEEQMEATKRIARLFNESPIDKPLCQSSVQHLLELLSLLMGCRSCL